MELAPFRKMFTQLIDFYTESVSTYVTCTQAHATFLHVKWLVTDEHTIPNMEHKIYDM